MNPGSKITLHRWQALRLLVSCAIAYGIIIVTPAGIQTQETDELTPLAQEHFNRAEAAKRHADFSTARAECLAALEIEARRDPHSVGVADIYNLLGVIERQSGNFDDAVEYYRKAISILGTRPGLGPEHPRTANIYMSLGVALDAKKNFKEASRYLRWALKIFRQSPQVGPRHPWTAVCLTNLGALQNDERSYGEAVESLQEALNIKIHDPELGPADPSTATTYNLLGIAYKGKGDYEKALEMFHEARKIREEHSQIGPMHPATAMAYNNIGSVLMLQGNADGAREYFEKALAINQARLGNHPETATSYNNLAEVYRMSGDLERAAESVRQAISILEGNSSIGPEHPLTAIAYQNVGSILYQGGHYDEAVEVLDKARKILESHPSFGVNRAETASVYTNLGSAYHGLRKFDLGTKYFRKALEVYAGLSGSYSEDEAYVFNNLAMIFLDSGDLSAAGKSLEKAIQLREKSPLLGKEHPVTAVSYVNYAEVCRKLGRIPDGIRYMESAIRIFEHGRVRDDHLIALRLLGVHFEKSNQSEKAIATYRKAARALLKYRLELGRGKTEFTQRFVDLFDRLIILEMKEGHLESAFRADMQRRGLSIAEELNLRSALVRGGVPASEAEKMLSLQRELESLQSQRAVALNRGAAGAADAARLLDEIQKKEKNRDAIDRDLVKRYPQYALLREPGAPAVAEIQQALRSGEVFVSYVMSGDSPFAFVISKDGGLAVAQLPGKSAELGLKIRNYHTLVSLPENQRGIYKKIQTKAGILIYSEGGGSGYKLKDDDKLYAKVRVRGAQARMEGDAKKPEFKEEVVGHVIGEMNEAEAEAMRRSLSAGLHEAMIAPVLAGCNARSLVMIPDGAAYYLPFGILTDKEGKRFGDIHEFKLAHSGTVWMRLRRMSPSHAKEPVLAMGNAIYSSSDYSSTRRPVRGQTRSPGGAVLDELGKKRTVRTGADELGGIRWDNLHGTEEEVVSIAALAYSDAARRDDAARLGVDASTDTVVRLNGTRALEKYRMLHFSVHGLFVDGNPSLNALVFTLPGPLAELRKSNPAVQKKYDAYVRKNGNLKQDGYLRLGEVKSLYLDADLVVMSACETSLGHEIGGEGMVGLPQAFLIAGSRNVVASLWSVDDAATSLLMQEMYRNILEKKMEPRAALREAQKKVRSDPRFADPFYWAAFVIYGE